MLFDVGRRFEDQLLLPILIDKCKSIFECKDLIVKYRQISSSITKNLNISDLDDSEFGLVRFRDKYLKHKNKYWAVVLASVFISHVSKCARIYHYNKIRALDSFNKSYAIVSMKPILHSGKLKPILYYLIKNKLFFRLISSVEKEVKNKMTLVTIFTPTFNRSHVLKRCYLSILEQHRDDIEWLIIDDGSTDDTANIVKEFQNENKLKIKYIYQNNSGKQASWNRAVENAKGEYFIGVDSDDILATGSINNLLSIRDVFDDESIIGIRAISMNSNKMKPDSLYLYGRDDESSWFDEFRSGLRGERIDF